VIEALKNLSVKTINLLAAPGMISDMIHNISISQKFHLLDVESFSALTFNKPLFREENSDVRLPYGICWFDFLYKVNSGEFIGKICKAGILVSELGKDDLLLMQPFGVDIYSQTWTPSEGFYVFAMGRNFVNDDFLEEKREFNSEANIRRYTYWKENPSEEEWENIYERDKSFLGLVNETLLLLSCKNISTEKHEPTQALNKKRIANGRQPLFSYHTLIIKPTTQREKSIPQHLWHNRIHLCRGHFKTYTIEHPLFGKFTGRYWWQAHVAGRNREGVVLKDYEIKMDNVVRFKEERKYGKF